MTTTYFDHLGKDRKLRQILRSHQPLQLKKQKNIGLHLCRSIMGQQLSVKVASVIHARFLGLYGGRLPTYQQILDTPPETLRGIGLSNAKTGYVRNVAQYAIEHGMEDRKLYKMSNEEVMDFLLPIKGVGKWTIEMLLMFALAREDVFSVDDLGIQQSMTRLYGLDASDKKVMKETMLRISSGWAPYRTYACLHLWQHKDS